jgi:hypothetical protein
MGAEERKEERREDLVCDSLEPSPSSPRHVQAPLWGLWFSLKLTACATSSRPLPSVDRVDTTNVLVGLDGSDY